MLRLVSNSEVRFKVLGPRIQALEQALNQNKLGWREHFLSPESVFHIAPYSLMPVVIEGWFEMTSR